MATIIQPTPQGVRLPKESARAFQAFCIYRDLGPQRSLDRARERFCADQGKDRQSRRRPGNWSLWSAKFNWVERAEEYDDSVEEERREAASEQRRQLHEVRARFVVEEQQRILNRLRKDDAYVDKLEAASSTEVKLSKSNRAAGTTTTTTVKPPNPRDIAAVLKALNETSKQAMEGCGTTENDEVPLVDRIVWIPAAKKRDKAA
jgi:hypothetical protein